MERAQRLTRPVPLLLTLVLTALWTHSSYAQGLFGQNKIQYMEFEWQVMKTPNVDLHFYPQEHELAEWVAQVVDEAADEFLEAMNLELEKPIPFLLYSTPGAFQQTNASPYLIGEEVGGLTDLIKGRVMVPHNGSYHMLRWVVRHELVHAFMLEKLRQVLKENKKSRYSYPPLWYVEGLAEFLAAEWDSKADMIMRDAVINEQLVPIPAMWRIAGTFQMYKQGQSILLYVEREFGRDKVLQYLEDWYKDMSFEQLTEEILGISLEELSDRWVEDLKLRYYPQVETRDSIEVNGQRLVEHGRFNLRPCPLAPARGVTEDDATAGGGDDTASALNAARPGESFDFVFLSSYGGFTNIRLARHTAGTHPREGPKPELLIKGGTSERFESLHFFQNSIDANPDREIVFVARKGERDVLHVYGVDDRELRETLEFPDLVSLKSPGWSPDGEWIVFSGVNLAGHRDIYTVHRSGADLRQISDDHFDDLDPDWSPDGRTLVFSSDRCLGGHDGAYNLYLFDLETGVLEQLTAGPFEDSAPAWSPDGELIAFRSNRIDEAYDLYVANLAGELQPVAQRQTALLDPEWGPDGRSLLCTSFIDGTFGVFSVPIDPKSLPSRRAQPEFLASTKRQWEPHPLGAAPAQTWAPETPDSSYTVDDYRRRFGLDLVTGGVAYDPEFGNSAGGGQIILSDLLGDERLQFFIANDGGGGVSNFLDSFDLGFTYFNLSRRLNWGVGAFRLARTYNADLDLFLREARVGGILMASYPLSRFDRFETSLVFRTISDHLYRSGIFDDTFFVSNFFSYVHDTTLWSYLGPFDGTRYNVTVGLTADVSKGIGDFTSLQVDYRKYHRLLRRMNHAFRAIGRFSFGEEGPAYYVGGPFSLRGFPRRSVLGQRLIVLNNEVRFPLIERFVVNFGPGLVDFPILNGATFFDVAWAGDPGRSLEPLGSYGLGVYIGGGPFPRLRVDWSWLTDFETAYFRRDTEFSVGFDF